MLDRRRNFALKLLGDVPDPDYRRGRTPGDLQPAAGKEAGPSATIRPNRAGRLEPKTRVVPSACFSCNTNCEVLVLVDEASGHILKVEGDPGSPVTKGVLCAKGLAARDLLDNPGRLRTPLKRVGERGQGQWKPISWDEALSLVAEKLVLLQREIRSARNRFPGRHTPGVEQGFFTFGLCLWGHEPWGRRLGPVPLAAVGR